MSRKYFSVFRSPHLPLDTLIKKSSFSWTNPKRPAVAGLFLLVYKGLKFSKSIYFQSFSGNHFSPRFMVPCSLLAENIFSVFRSPHLPLDTPFWTRGFPLVMRSRKAGFPFATRARKREPCLQRYVSRMTRTENFLSQFFFKVFLETTFLHVLWYPVYY